MIHIPARGASGVQLGRQRSRRPAAGDNRANSNGSRSWGSVPVEDITNRVRGIFANQGKARLGVSRFGGVE